MPRLILLSAALLVGICTASATILPYSWQRFDVYKNPGADATGNNHPITGGFTGNGESPFGTLQMVDNIAVGGPLGPEGYFSRYSIRSRANQFNNQGTMFCEPSPLNTATFTNTSPWGNFFQTNDNWVVEAWVLPSRNGVQNTSSPIFATGINRNNRSQGRQSGICLEVINGQSAQSPAQNDGHVFMRCHAICPANVVDTNGLTMDFYIGPPILVKTPTNAAWIHAAVVRDTVAGTVAWYTNGVMVAATNIWRVYTTNYFSCIGVAGIQDSGLTHTNGGIGLGAASQAYEGYIAELRWSSFLPGEFSVTNLLTRRTAAGSPTVYYGPTIVKDPQNVTVWAGAAAGFACVAATDTSITYQWQRNSTNITDATNRIYVVENTSVGADNGAQFRCILTANSLSVTSTVATLSVLANSPAFVTGYSNTIAAETSLLAYFPVDGTTGTVLNNVKDPARNGVIINAPFAFRNGSTNVAAGNQGMSFNSPNLEYTGGYGLKTNTHGYVEIPGDNAAFDFAASSGGNGTVEAVLYTDPSAKNVLTTAAGAEYLCWFSSGSTYNASGTSTKPAFDYFTFGVDSYGGLHYQNSSGADLVWSVSGGMIGKRRHVAFVFSNTTNVTCYVDAVNLGTKQQSAFGNTPPSASQPLTIGKRGGANADIHGYYRDVWHGSVDDLAIYGSALSASSIATHYYRLINGANDTPASIAKITPSKNLYVGFPVQTLSVTAGGNAPFTYQWRSNGVNIAGANGSTHNFVGTGVPAGIYPFSVVVQGAIGGAITSAPVTLTVITPTGYGAKVYASSGGGPKAFYPLDETSGVNVLDWAGTHDGELSGAYQLGNLGPGGAGTGSLRMFGTNRNNGGVEILSQAEIPYYPELNPENGGNFTHEFWFLPDDTNVTSCPVSSQANIGNAKAGLATCVGPGNTGVAATTIQNWTMIYGKYNNLNQGVAQNGAGGVIPPVQGQWQHIASVADGNSATVTIYVNGQPDFTQNVSYSQHPGDGSVTSGVNQNYYAPLILGNINLGAFPMAGRLSQVAIYDYALTFSDITNHTSQIWTQALITLQPVGVTNVESFTTQVTLTANASGVPNNYQWYKDGVPLAQSLNLDGSEHYPGITNAGGASQGVISKRLVINQTKTNDTGSYVLQVINPLNSGGFTNTVSANVRITSDTTLPVVTNVSTRGTMVSGPVLDEATTSGGNPTPAPLFLVEAKFSKRLDWASATNPANYTISGGVLVTNVVLANSVADTRFGGDYRAVGLITAGLTPGNSYTLTVNNVYDQASFSNKVAPTTIPFIAPGLRANSAVWNYYYRIPGNFAGLVGGVNSVFPYIPQFTAALTNFSSDAVAFGQNLGNNALFTGQADTYASTISALVTPTNTGFYEFFINADDRGRLYLNPSGSDPAGAMWIGDSFSTGTAFNDLFSISTHYQLTAGQPYFLQAIQTENTGNDHVRVGWRYLGTVDQAYDGTGANGAWIVDAASLTPIAGQFLSSYTFGGPAIITQPTSIVAAAGSTTNLFVVASSDSGLLSYQWQTNAVNVAGKTAATNSFAPLLFANFSTNNRVVVNDGLRSVTSSVVAVTPPAPSIVTPPTGKAVPQGLPTSLTVAPATFSGQTNYQWRFNAANVAGANYGGTTARTLTIGSMQASNAGPYVVVVNDGFTALSLTSSPAANLTVASNPVITNSVSGATLSMTFPTEVGPQYVVEWKGAMTNGAWNRLITNVGNGGPFTVPVGMTNSQQYFRLRMQ